MWLYTKQVLYVYILVKFANCCDCNKRNDFQNDTQMITISDEVTVDNRQLKDNNTSLMAFTKAYSEEHEDLEVNERNITHFKTDVSEYDSNENLENDYARCPYLKSGNAFNLDRMADVWQVIYHRTTDILSCFKIYIRKTTVAERKYYAQIYGSFNGSISWMDCLLEIRSSERHYSSGRKHFLRGTNINKGVFENIIVMKDNNAGKSSNATLSVESPDQWMVINNLLMMRDCDSGHVIVFSRVPHQPRLDTVLYSLKVFGEESLAGVLACGNDGRVGRSIQIIPKDILRRYFRVG